MTGSCGCGPATMGAGGVSTAEADDLDPTCAGEGAAGTATGDADASGAVGGCTAGTGADEVGVPVIGDGVVGAAGPSGRGERGLSRSGIHVAKPLRRR